MKCPYCGSWNQTCFDSRPSRDGTERKRSRKCLDCGRNFHTIERIIEIGKVRENPEITKEEQP